MPFAGRDAAVLCVLVFCVPLQHWLTQRSVVSSEERSMRIFRFFREMKIFYENYFSLATWREWLLKLIEKHITVGSDYSHWYSLDLTDPEGECPAVEVMNLRNPEGHFGMSPRPRLTRPVGLKWRVGQVVKHKRWGYHGVIIGWDQKCKAPETWIQKMHDGRKEWRTQPNYALLVEVDDREPQITYVPQENIYVIKDLKINHPELHEYFESFDGAQYIPHKWLRAIYPLD
ncbi:hypothetical protein SK128_022497 [Halocaridina rubra]|uniref:Hemimethylated DNA-binding domain-containing protein n=1 Tax=Halocaridina rubra TaxID=373956 RepID=A0AAN8WI87_HALRR